MKYTIMDTLLYASEMDKDVDVLLLEFAGFEPSERNIKYLERVATPHARVQALRHVLNAAPCNRISVAQQAIKNLSK
jgi:hypothetical protein